MAFAKLLAINQTWTEHQRYQLGLPVSKGGTGLRDWTAHGPVAHVASWALTAHRIQALLGPASWDRAGGTQAFKDFADTWRSLEELRVASGDCPTPGRRC